MVESFPNLRKFSIESGYSNRGIDSRQGAKHAKFGSLILCDLFGFAQDMLCVFERDIPSFGCGFAALGLSA